MITNYLSSFAVEPAEVDALQSAFNALKARFAVTTETDKALLGTLLIGAYNTSRNAEAAQQVAGGRFETLFLNKTGLSPLPPA